MKFIDVTVPLDGSIPLYPGNTPFSVEAIKRLARGESSNVSTIHMSAHAGTHVDAPWHVFDEAPRTESLSLDVLCGPARVIALDTRTCIAAHDLAHYDFTADTRLLLKTRNSTLWESPAFHADYVGMTADAAHLLVERGIKVIGVDYLTVEEFRKPGAPAHRALLGAGMHVIEGLNLLDVEPGIYDMLCLPLAIIGSDGAPARVVLRRL